MGQGKAAIQYAPSVCGAGHESHPLVLTAALRVGVTAAVRSFTPSP